MRILIAGILILGATFTSAEGAFIANGGFESGIKPGSFTSIAAGDSTSITGWTVGGAGVDYIGSLLVAGEGTRCIDLSRVTAGSISQSLQGLVAGTAYDVSFLLAGNSDRSLGDNTSAIKHLLVSAGGKAQAFTFDITGHTPNSMGWTRMDFIFVASSATATLTFASQDNNPYGPALDGVDVVALPSTVPEPASAILLGLGGLAVAAVTRRQSA